MKRYVRHFKEIKENEAEKLSNKLDTLSDTLVPSMGMAETVEGEMIRAAQRLIYRYQNDGDYFFRGYGKQTAYPSAKYLAKQTPISKILSPLLRKAQMYAGKPDNDFEFSEDDMYQHYLYEVIKEIVAYVDSKKGKYTPNEVDSNKR